VARLDERIGFLNESVDRLSGDIRGLNEAVRDIERWRWKITGALLVVSGLGGVLAGVASRLIAG
jgi:hypothetical protein